MVNDAIRQAIEDVRKAAEDDVNGNDQAHVDLLNAIQKLNLAAEAPKETLMRMRFEPNRYVCIRLALEAGILEAISAKNGEDVTADELATLTKNDALFIARIMRLVTNGGVVDEVGPTTYKANEMTRLIVTPGLAGGEKHHYDLLFPVGAKLMEYYHKTNIHQFPKEGEPSPFEYALGKPFWQYFNDVPEQRTYFDDYMATRREGLVKWYETFPIADVLCPDAKKDSDATLLVDVGGNWGHEVAAFHEAYSEAPGRLILQDLPEMVEKVKREKPPKGVECMAYDFFTPQPVKGARAYYFRSVFHDWSDEHCEKILSNTVRSMEKGYSRVLIDDYCLPDVGAPMRGSAMDIFMMMVVSGMERTRGQWEGLLDRCGLEIVKVWGTRSDYEQVIEARLKE